MRLLAHFVKRCDPSRVEIQAGSHRQISRSQNTRYPHTYEPEVSMRFRPPPRRAGFPLERGGWATPPFKGFSPGMVSSPLPLSPFGDSGLWILSLPRRYRFDLVYLAFLLNIARGWPRNSHFSPSSSAILDDTELIDTIPIINGESFSCKGEASNSTLRANPASRN